MSFLLYVLCEVFLFFETKYILDHRLKSLLYKVNYSTLYWADFLRKFFYFHFPFHTVFLLVLLRLPFTYFI